MTFPTIFLKSPDYLNSLIVCLVNLILTNSFVTITFLNPSNLNSFGECLGLLNNIFLTASAKSKSASRRFLIATFLEHLVKFITVLMSLYAIPSPLNGTSGILRTSCDFLNSSTIDFRCLFNS